VLPADLIWASQKIEQYEEGEVEQTQKLELDSTEEVRVNATLQSARYLQGLRRHYNKSTQQRSIQVRDLVLRRIQKN
jgi:DNA-directed RNA polymerase beta' subunit